MDRDPSVASIAKKIEKNLKDLNLSIKICQINQIFNHKVDTVVFDLDFINSTQ